MSKQEQIKKLRSRVEESRERLSTFQKSLLELENTYAVYREEHMTLVRKLTALEVEKDQAHE